MNLRGAWSVFVLATLVLGATSGQADEKTTGWTPLFNGKDLSGWRIYLNPKKPADPNDIWSVRDGLLRCDGSVYGYLITDKNYGDFVLRLQWRWGTKVTRGRNSGVFVWVSGPDKIWPKGVEAQLQIGHAGDIWLVDGFKLQADPSRRDPRSARHYLNLRGNVEKPIGEWNQYEITCKEDTLKLMVNGQLQNQGSRAEARKGKILLQSEGAEVFFRNIEIKSLK